MHQKIIFVNGYLFPGTYPGGEGYWLGADSPFVTGAHTFLQSQLPPHFTDIQHHPLSGVPAREEAGWQYAEQYYPSLTAGILQEQDHFNFVTHSMGAAFAEGMIAFLQQQGYHVRTVIHFNAFQAADINVNKGKYYVIDYQSTNDPLINNPVYAKPGDIKNADLKIRQKSNKHYFKRHRDPIDSDNAWLVLRGSVNGS